MAIWELAQHNYEALLAEGLHKLLITGDTMPSGEAPLLPGNLLFLLDECALFASETEQLAKHLKRQMDPHYSVFYRKYQRSYQNADIALEDFSLRWMPVSIARKELFEFCCSNLSTPLNTYRSDRFGSVLRAGTYRLWDQMQGISSQLLEEGKAFCRAGEAVRWGSAVRMNDPGVYFVRSPEGRIIYIGEVGSLHEQYRVNGSDTYASLLRRNLAERHFRFRLHVQDGERRYLHDEQEAALTDYLRACTIAFTPVRFGRVEVCETLISEIRPPMNDVPDKSPFARAANREPSVSRPTFAERLLGRKIG